MNIYIYIYKHDIVCTVFLYFVEVFLFFSGTLLQTSPVNRWVPSVAQVLMLAASNTPRAWEILDEQI